MRFDIDDRDPARYAVTAYAAAHPSTQTVNREPLFVAAVGGDARRRVALVSGGGSGHEPLHTGLVGPGGLDAAVPGRIFASPHSRQIYEAGLAVAHPEGVLLIVKNYTGDVVNFGIAAERIGAHGIAVGTLLVADDIASADEGDEEGAGPGGMRGTGVTVVVEQLLARAADEGAGLDELLGLGHRIVSSSRSIAVADVAHHSHVTGERAFDIAGGVEFGVGIHGERSSAALPDAGGEAAVDAMVDRLIASLPDGADRVLLLCNDLGAMSAIELSAVAGHAARRLEARDVRVGLIAQGAFVTALDMRGFSLTVVEADPEWEGALLAERSPLPFPRWDRWQDAGTQEPEDIGPRTEERRAAEGVLAVAERLLADVRDSLTRLDQLAGDGDFGDNMAFAVERGRERWAGGAAETETAALRDAFLDDVGGSSGPLFGLVLQHLGGREDGDAPLERIARGLRRGTDAVSALGGARVGDSTMIDALEPAAARLEAGASDSSDAAATIARGALDAATAGADSTAGIAAHRGRSRYLGDRAAAVPDPGAVGVVVLLAALLSEFDPALEERARHYVKGLPALV
jgi:dihydroxyacetone kinase